MAKIESPSDKTDNAEKPAKKPAPKSPPRQAAAPPGAGIVIGHKIFKLAGFVVGLPAAMICVMALIGGVTENGYVRFFGALVLVLGLPLFIADRLLPNHDPTKARGLVSDVLAVSWTLATFVIAGALGGTTRPMLGREGDLLVKAGYPDLARGAFLLAGFDATIPNPEPAPVASASSSASAALSAAPVDAGAPVPTADPVVDAGKPLAPTPKGSEKNPAELFKELAPSVVTVTIKKNGSEGGGTGFLVDNDGTIATNHHVIDAATAVRVKFQNGTTYEDVELLIDEVAADLALIHINLATPIDGGVRPDATPMHLGDSEAVVVGEHAISIGNPLGLEHTLTDGLISSRRVYDGKAWIQFSAPISPGNSGGPLFNMRGDVIGISTATLSSFGGGAQNLNLAVPVNELKKLFRPVYPGRRKFGSGNGPSVW
jgi:S1-C subfamily serine protease